MESNVEESHIRDREPRSTTSVWLVASGIAAIGGLLLSLSQAVTIASGGGAVSERFSFSLWDFYSAAPTSSALLDGVAPFLLAFGIYTIVLSLFIWLMTFRNAAAGLRRALAYVQGLTGLAFIGVGIAIYRQDVWGYASVSPSAMFGILIFVGSLLIVAGGFLGSLFGVIRNLNEGSVTWLFLNVRGRIPRQSWWVAYVALSALSYTVSFLLATITVWLLLPWFLFVLYAAVCIDGKRWHDRGRSAWWVTLYLVPIVGWIWVIVELGFLRGTPSRNPFGESPTDLDV